MEDKKISSVPCHASVLSELTSPDICGVVEKDFTQGLYPGYLEQGREKLPLPVLFFLGAW
jgi:hypothetical protein